MRIGRSWNATTACRYQKFSPELPHRAERIARIEVLGSKSRDRGGGQPVSRPDYYRQYALECFRLANDSTEPSNKAVLIDKAQGWGKLAEQPQRNRPLDPVLEAPSPRPVPAAS